MQKIGLARASLAGLATFGIVLAIAITFGRTEVPHALGFPEEAAATLRSLYRLLALACGLVNRRHALCG